MAITATTEPTGQSTLSGDIIGGITTFFTMVYIVVVNPSILSTPGTGMPFTGAMTATVLIAFSMTLLMGLYARLPFSVAPGMGLNAFFAFTIVLQQQLPWQTALGMVFWAGVLFLVVSATPLREMIALAIPPGLRLAAAAGIGLLLTLIGMALNNVILTAAAAMLLVISGVSWLWAELSLRGLVYHRRFSEVRAFRGEVVELALELHNTKLLPQPWVTVHDSFPFALPVAEALRRCQDDHPGDVTMLTVFMGGEDAASLLSREAACGAAWERAMW